MSCRLLPATTLPQRLAGRAFRSCNTVPAPPRPCPKRVPISTLPRYLDELAWCALWLHRATGEGSFLATAEALWSSALEPLGTPWAFDWDDKTAAVTVLLSTTTGKGLYGASALRYLNDWLPGGTVP